jgi:cytochrome c biogenesis factor
MVWSKKSMRWTIILIIVAVIGIVSAWSILSRQANQNKSYTGAKFIGYETGGSMLESP